MSSPRIVGLNILARSLRDLPVIYGSCRTFQHCRRGLVSLDPFHPPIHSVPKGSGLSTADHISSVRSSNQPVLFQMVFYPLLFAVPFLYISAFIFDEPMVRSLGGGVVAAILYQGMVTGSFGFVAWNMLLKCYGAVSLHTFLFIMPVVGVLLGGFLLKKPISGNILTALVLIGAGIFITQFTKKLIMLWDRMGNNTISVFQCCFIPARLDFRHRAG